MYVSFPFWPSRLTYVGLIEPVRPVSVLLACYIQRLVTSLPSALVVFYLPCLPPLTSSRHRPSQIQLNPDCPPASFETYEHAVHLLTFSISRISSSLPAPELTQRLMSVSDDRHERVYVVSSLYGYGKFYHGFRIGSFLLLFIYSIPMIRDSCHGFGVDFRPV